MRSYTPEAKFFSKICMDPKCMEKTVTCTICGHKGHPDVYKHDENHVIPVIEHAHFLYDHDRGRNVFHSHGAKSKIPATEEMKQYTWRTKREISRWIKIPKSVRVAIGWDSE